MRHAEFNPSALPAALSAKAEREQELLTAAKRRNATHNIAAPILSELKEWLLQNVFYGKCAVCEYDVVPEDYADAGTEHYRPPSLVTEPHGMPVIMPAGHPHPGYYWVAYDWRNMLPLCAQCSRTGRTQFPINGLRVDDPAQGPTTGELDALELPCLLNPYRDMPSQHIKFGQSGLVTGVTPNGQATITAWHLDYDVFNVARQIRQDKAVARFNYEMDRSRRQGLPLHAVLQDFYKSFTGPKAPFAQAVSDYLEIAL